MVDFGYCEGSDLKIKLTLEEIITKIFLRLLRIKPFHNLRKELGMVVLFYLFKTDIYFSFISPIDYIL